MSSTYLAVRLKLEDDLRHDPRLTPFTFKVAIDLVRRRHADTGRCDVSIPVLAKALSCGARTVDRALIALVEAGWIVKTSGKGRTTNSYAIPRLDHSSAPGAAPGAGGDLFSRQNGATTETSPRQDDVTTEALSRQNGASDEPLSRHFDRVVAPFSTSLSRQNGAQSLLRNSLKDLTPKAPGVEAERPEASGGDGVSTRARPDEKPGNCIRQAFGQFWEAWPNKVGKPAAEKAFRKHAGQVEAIIAGVERYIATKPADRPWLNPATFLNQERWKDQPAAVTIASAVCRRPPPVDDPDDPHLEFPGKYRRRRSFVIAALTRFATDRRSWPHMLGPPPGSPGCCVPKALLAKHLPSPEPASA